ncbi:uncharacterized protein FA14DRAFT_176248 [Meira miltonrushii]|uniref:Uncharacterized protein n=1 Tax=Meira miltonrushii TaxID=1280837 RepID=A0A316VN08_9BASI|nr:uncharacterized protein FA14DRAFT_176248 [Meira miltonrushii]PWN36945.1 hypothetical protein FA14DRAFT_176248 [Meira miltonrushii]
MKLFYIFFFALIALQAVFATDLASISAKLQTVNSACDKVSQLSSSIKVTADVASSIEADVTAIVSALGDAQAEISAYVGTLAAADVDAIIKILVKIEVGISVGIKVIIGLQAGLNAIGEDTKLGDDLANLQVAIKAFVGVFLGKCPSASKSDASSVCNKLQSDAKSACSAYSSCS